MEKCFSGELLCSDNSVGYTFFCFIPVKTERNLCWHFFYPNYIPFVKKEKKLKCNNVAK